MIDFRALSYFVAACEHESLGAAAADLEIAPSTLSASLKSLESGFGASLFRRHENGLAPRRLAHWLYRRAVPVLLLEEFMQRRARAPDEASARLTIDIRLRFAFGHVRRALARASAAAAEEAPILINPQWVLEGDNPSATSLVDLHFGHEHRVTIEPMDGKSELTGGDTLLGVDPWMLVERRYGAGELEGAGRRDQIKTPWLVPALPEPLAAQISERAAAEGRELRMLDTPPDSWPQLLEDYPSGQIALPSSAIGTRLGLSRIVTRPLVPALHSTLVARPDGSDAAAAFLAHVRTALEDGLPSRAFMPKMTERRMRYFNLAYRTGRVSAASKAAGVAQPAMSQQLQKLEESLGVLLFDRKSFGLVRTAAADELALATELLDRHLRDVEVSGATATLADGGRLSLGVLPSTSPYGRLIATITDTVLALRTQTPLLSLLVREGPNASLQRWVKQGRLGIAIVDVAPPQMPRLTLDSSEPLALIAHPRHELLPPGPVAFADLAGLPLALPTNLFGLRQILDNEARAAGFDLKPLHEIDSLAMLSALIARDRMATVLPISAISSEIAAGGWTAHPIEGPKIHRRLYAIYSGDRALTQIEREFIRRLRSALAAGADILSAQAVG
ncbi:hypothetical protein Sj15T_24950 [Sphingobium sp. TA15]|uniref:LysR-family transcriptional regulator n=1 Tax=Sphingobium indicum (strain DSM 16413 / CCM 7287 / MTCC 6362 / UT26 / NBRC 101211 / UT26S) TaxID=452662 RepID=D4Z665_SPHIU|nr:LysR family transcriptional regulator [Sphingobium indicum]BAI98097.1 LysR-family transcriptional regulator [Sphingobium indicum UT26S]BDD67474.1 hypothetical protein Sj15T_24950 [Sphingobium sp. TA15]